MNKIAYLALLPIQFQWDQATPKKYIIAWPLETKALSDLRVVAALAAVAEKTAKTQEIELRQLVKVPWFKSV